MTPSFSDFTNGGSLLVLGLGQVVTWFLISADRRREGEKRVAERAENSAKQVAAEQQVSRELSRVALAFEGLTREFQQHVVGDATYHARNDEITQQLSETQATLARVQESQQKEIATLAMGLATEVQARVAPRPARRRGA